VSESQSDAQACSICGAAYDPGTRFCGNCGAELRSEGRVELAATAPGGVRAFDLEPDPSVPRIDAPDPMLGRVIDGRYRVQTRLGQGGMGVVYRVEHVAMGKVAAMKVLHPSLSQEAEIVQRFRREAEAVSRLSHPNSVQVFDFGEAMGSLYLVMELVRGEELGAILRRDGPFTWRRLAPVMLQVLDALAEAHELGVIHRDLKPENLVVARTRDGRDLVKVLDFGLAKLRDVEEVNSVTARGNVIGTPYYMSPEQIRAEDLDARSDLYSLGALIYRALSGEHPFAAPTPVAVLTQHLTMTLPPLRERAPKLDIPLEAETIVMRAMEKTPGARFQSAEEMREAIAQAVSSPTSTSSPSVETKRRESDTSSPAVAAVGVAERMKREDFDSYERSLHRRRWVGLLIVPFVLLLGAAAAVYALRHGGASVLDEEQEPNNDPATANLIESGRAIRGHIGLRRSVEESDRDFFHIVVAPPNDRLTVEVTGVPEMDTILQLFDERGALVAESETGAEGDAEGIFDRRVTPGDYYVEVRQVWVSGEPALENMSDWYSLKAVVDRSTPDVELEPNDDPARANVLGPSNVVTGRLTHPGDIDCFAPNGPRPTAIGASVTALPGVDLRLSIVPSSARVGQIGQLGQKVPGVRVADSAPTGEPEHLDKAPWLALASPVACVERIDRLPKHPGDHAAHNEHPAHIALPSRSATYRLTIDVTR
jgi:serine/threonine-protein kinase